MFTPSTKAEIGEHDEAIDFAAVVAAVGAARAEELRELTLALYSRAAEIAPGAGIVLADTKFEFGLAGDGALVLGDEVLTPDSSRFWPASTWSPGSVQPSYDKQYVRDWLTSSGWDRVSPPPELPDDVVAATRERYVTAYEQLTGRTVRLTAARPAAASRTSPGGTGERLLLLLHGARRDRRGVAARAAAGRGVAGTAGRAAPDLRGHGLSRAEPPYALVVHRPLGIGGEQLGPRRGRRRSPARITRVGGVRSAARLVPAARPSGRGRPARRAGRSRRNWTDDEVARTGRCSPRCRCGRAAASAARTAACRLGPSSGAGCVP